MTTHRHIGLSVSSFTPYRAGPLFDRSHGSTAGRNLLLPAAACMK